MYYRFGLSARNSRIVPRNRPRFLSSTSLQFITFYHVVKTYKRPSFALNVCSLFYLVNMVEGAEFYSLDCHEAIKTFLRDDGQ